MSFTKEDFEREYIKAMWPKLSPEERRDGLEELPLEERLSGLTDEEIQKYLSNRRAEAPASKRKPKGKKRG